MLVLIFWMYLCFSLRTKFGSALSRPGWKFAISIPRAKVHFGWWLWRERSGGAQMKHDETGASSLQVQCQWKTMCLHTFLATKHQLLCCIIIRNSRLYHLNLPTVWFKLGDSLQGTNTDMENLTCTGVCRDHETPPKTGAEGGKLQEISRGSHGYSKEVSKGVEKRNRTLMALLLGDAKIYNVSIPRR